MAARAAQKLQGGSVEPVRPWPHRFTTIFRRRTGLSTVVEVAEEDQPCHERSERCIMRKLRPDMIRRMDDAPRPVDPSGWISEGQSVPMKGVSTALNHQRVFADGPPSCLLPQRNKLPRKTTRQLPDSIVVCRAFGPPYSMNTWLKILTLCRHVRRTSDPGPSNLISSECLLLVASRSYLQYCLDRCESNAEIWNGERRPSEPRYFCDA
jgi:hypothetical protein